MSALRASETPSTAASPEISAERTVLLPGSPATYANRAFLKGLGLRWDPEGHRWHGVASAENVRALREQLGLEVRCFGILDATTDVAPKPACPPVLPVPPVRPRVHDGSRTHVEAQIAFPADAVAEDEIVTPTRRFTIDEITSGLPDDSLEEDERAAARHLRDLRGRVKAARVIVSTTPGLSDALQSDWKRAARFYARFGITEVLFRHGASAWESEDEGNPSTHNSPLSVDEVRERDSAILPVGCSGLLSHNS